MRLFLDLAEDDYQSLIKHLLSKGSKLEEAAFLFVNISRGGEVIVLESVATQLLAARDFVQQQSDYLELSDHTRASLIKSAHDRSCGLIELHSHRGPWPAEFSPADVMGLHETVQHISWRLPGQPYGAIVVSPSGFDALFWTDTTTVPRTLDALRVGGRLLQPTNRSIGGWNEPRAV